MTAVVIVERSEINTFHLKYWVYSNPTTRYEPTHEKLMNVNLI